MKRALFTIVAVLFLAGQAWAGDCPDVIVQKDINIEQFDGQPWCRHKALLAAVIYGEYYPVRFQSGPIKCSGGYYHVQAQAYIDKQWKWLKLDICNRPYVGEQDNWFTPDTIYTINEYIKEQKETYWWTSNEKGTPMLVARQKVLEGVASGSTSYSIQGGKP